MKEEYRLLNEAQIDISKYEEEKVEELEKKRMMKKFISSNKKKRRINNKKILAGVAALFIVINLGIYKENVSAAVESFKYNISNWLGVGDIENNYSAEIGETIKEGGIEVTLNEFFTDNDRIIINLETNKEVQELADEHKDLIPDFYVNGDKVEIDVSYVGYSIVEVNKKEAETQVRSNIILEIAAKGLNLSKEENVKLVFSTLGKKMG